MDEARNENDVAVKQMVNYIESHLQQAITAGDIARAAGYSQYHAARLFKARMGLSPFEYIRRERLIESAHALRNGTPKVLDIAFDFVFDSHEGFTRAFSNALYMNYLLAHFKSRFSSAPPVLGFHSTKYTYCREPSGY